jgi:hypothetical protein
MPDLQKAAYESLVSGRLGRFELADNKVDASLRSSVVPNWWMNLLPNAFSNLNTFMYNSSSRRNCFQSTEKPKLKPVIVVHPLENISPKEYEGIKNK